MKLRTVKVGIELVVGDDCGISPESIANYLNDKLYNDPEFFGDFGPENILEVKEWTEE